MRLQAFTSDVDVVSSLTHPIVKKADEHVLTWLHAATQKTVQTENLHVYIHYLMNIAQILLELIPSPPLVLCPLTHLFEDHLHITYPWSSEQCRHPHKSSQQLWIQVLHQNIRNGIANSDWGGVLRICVHTASLNHSKVYSIHSSTINSLFSSGRGSKGVVLICYLHPSQVI